MSRVIAEGASSIWTIVGCVAEVVAKRIKVSKTTVLGMSWGSLLAIRAFIVQAINTKMPKGVAVITDSFRSRLHGRAQTGISRVNVSGVGGSVVLVKGRMRVSRGINESGSG